MKYHARPFAVEAEEIKDEKDPNHGDYLVTEKKGGKDEVLIVPKQEFERKFIKATDSPHGAA